MEQITVDLDDELVSRAAELSGIEDPDALVRAAFQALVEREASRRLAKLGGTEPDLVEVPRRRFPE